MTYEEFLKIKTLLAEREHLKKGLSLLREMTVKTTSASLDQFQVRLVFTETVDQEFYPTPSWEGGISSIISAMGLKAAMLPGKSTKEKGMVMLDDIMLLKVAGAMADHGEERVQDINVALKALGIDP